MARCLLVGADRTGTKEKYLCQKFNVNNITHWDGRTKKLPNFPNVELVVILTGFINHGLMSFVRKEAKKRDIKIVFLNRGRSELEKGA